MAKRPWKYAKTQHRTYSEEHVDTVFHESEELVKGKRIAAVIKKYQDGSYKIQLHREYHRQEGGYATYPLNSIGEEELDVVMDLLKRAKKGFEEIKEEDDKKRRDEMRELLLKAKALKD